MSTPEMISVDAIRYAKLEEMDRRAVYDRGASLKSFLFY
jgi:hypothetical protein